MAIRYDGSSGLFSLTTAHTLYQMRVDRGGVLTHLYYGRDTGCDMGPLLRRADRGFSGNPYEQRQDRSFSLDTLSQEYSGSGAGDYRVSALRLTGPDGSRSVDVRYHGHRITAGKTRPEGLPWARPDDDTETLVIELRDPVNGLRVELTYAVYPARDVITRSARLVNGGEGTLTLEAAASLCLDFPDGDLDVLHFPGRYAMERTARRERLPQGVTAFGSRRGMSSHHHNPFLILCERGTGEDFGACWGFMLAYSGSHQEAIEVDHAGGARLVMGIHPDDFAWPLQPGEAFQTPEAIMSFSDAGFNGLSAGFHALLRDDVMPPRFRHAPRPLLINSWEAVYFDFDADKLVRLAAQGRDLGMDMLVLDDGWFGRRVDDNSSLGDWRVNEAKLGCGLGELSDRVHALGMKFGLWIEPEMVSEDSDLYRAHPDWALQDPGRRPMLSRNQLALDMSRDDVVDHLFDALCAVLDSARIEYVKWDFNRPLANLWSHALPADQQGTVGHRCVLGTYRLLERLTERYPDLLIEGCAGGGGRFDAGMLYYCPQIWCSDDTDALERLEIQRGTSYGYPACAVGSHVSASPNHQTGRAVPMDTRGIVAQSGTFGCELDPAKLTDDEKASVRAQAEAYRRNRELIFEGTQYRLGELGEHPDYCAWMFVSPDRSEALVNLVAARVRANGLFPRVKLKGLDPDARYRVDGFDAPLTGAALMYGGLTFPQLTGDYPARQVHLVRMRQ